MKKIFDLTRSVELVDLELTKWIKWHSWLWLQAK